MLKLKSMIACLIIFAFVISGCSNSSSSASEEGSLKIGYVGGLSGATASFGIPTFEAVEYAIKEINDNGGINGKTVELVKEDDEGNPFKGQQAIDKFANDEIHYVISGSSSAVALSQVAKVKQNNMIAVSPVASDPKVVSDDPYFFVNLANNNQFGWSAAYYAANEMDEKEMIAFVRDDAYGTSILKAFKEKYEENGGKIVKEFKYPVDAKDFNSYISQGMSQYPNATIFATGYAADTGLIAKQARAIGYDKPIVATNPISNPQYLEIAGDATNNTILSSAYISDVSVGEETKKFIETWKSEFDIEPNVYQIHGYDAVNILKTAIESADSFDTEKVQQELLKIKDYVGASGVTSFNSDGSSTKPIYMIKWENKELKLEKTLEPGSY